MVSDHQDMQGLHTSTLVTQNFKTARCMLKHLGYGVGDDAPKFGALTLQEQDNFRRVPYPIGCRSVLHWIVNMTAIQTVHNHPFSLRVQI